MTDDAPESAHQPAKRLSWKLLRVSSYVSENTTFTIQFTVSNKKGPPYRGPGGREVSSESVNAGVIPPTYFFFLFFLGFLTSRF